MSPRIATRRRPPAVAARWRERGAHRDRVRVVGVVDQQAAARQRQLLAAPARELDVDPLGARQAERVERGQRGGGVRDLVLGREVEADAVDRRCGRPRARPRAAAGRTTVDVVALDRELLRHDRRPAGGQRRDQLALRPLHAFERADQLEVDRPDVRDHADVRPRDPAEVGDLAEAAHRELEDADLGVRLEAAERQRHADLVVEARLRGDRAGGRSAERGEDVLRRGLAGRAGDADDARVGAVANERAERGERLERLRRARASRRRRGRAPRCGTRPRARRRRTGRRARRGASRPGRR